MCIAEYLPTGIPVDWRFGVGKKEEKEREEKIASYRRLPGDTPAERREAA